MERAWMLLVLLPLCSGHSEYQGTVMTYYPLQTHPDGSVTVEVRYKSNSKHCAGNGYQPPSEGYHSLTQVVATIDNPPGGFCQIEAVWTRKGPSNAPILMRLMPRYLWSSPTINEVTTAQSSTFVELRRRSDTRQTNRSPQTTILPVYRVPYNCQRVFHLLNIDPDGDLVRCRFVNSSVDPTECLQCSPPSVLNLSPSCTLSFSGSGSGSQGQYAVQLMMEDFPRTDINLTLASGAQELRRTTDAISKVALQFLFSVESSAPSCSPGVDLPRFVEPTPEHGTQIRADASQTLQIHVVAENSDSMGLELTFSGPSGIKKTDVDGQRRFILSWTPVGIEDGQSHVVCFSAQTSTSKFSSEFRCVIANVGFDGPKVIRAVQVFQVQMSSSAPLTDEAVQGSLLGQIKLELEKRGQPQDMSVSLVSGSLSKKATVGSP